MLWISGRLVAKCDPLLCHSVRRSNMTIVVAQWATQLSISENIIKQKTSKFSVNN